MTAAERTVFACPVPWCRGDVAEHGGDGAAPDTWLHASDDLPIGGPLRVQRWREGGGADQWAIHSGQYAGVLESDDAEALALALERAALSLRGYAAQHAG